MGHGLRPTQAPYNYSTGTVTLLQKPQEFKKLRGSVGPPAGAWLLIMYWYIVIIIIIVQNMKRVTTSP